MEVGAFLDIDIHRNDHGLMELTQPGLIGKIIQACGLESESKRHDTPANTTILRRDAWRSEGACLEISHVNWHAYLPQRIFSP